MVPKGKTVISNRQRTSSGAMALLEKYENLTKGIQNARDEIIKETSKLEDVQQSIAESRVERSKMVVTEHDLKIEIKSLEEEERSVSKEFQILVSQDSALKQKKEGLERDFKLLQKYIKEERQDFLSRSRDFRSFCRRSKLELLSLPSFPSEEDENLPRDQDGIGRIITLDRNFGFGRLLYSSSEDDDSGGESEDELLDLQLSSILLPQTDPPTNTKSVDEHGVSDSEEKLRAMINLSVGKDEHSEKFCQERKDNCGALKLSKKRKRKHTQKNKAKRNSSNLAKQDEELERTKSRHLESISNRDTASQELQNVKTDYEAASRRADDRSEKLEQQRDQLRRVRRDVQEMENEMVELEANTREISDMRDGYIKAMESGEDIVHKQKQNTTSTPLYQTKCSLEISNICSVTPSPQIGINRSTSQSGNPMNPYVKKQTNCDRISTNKGRQRNQSSLRRQYPHRAGRIKVNRQFTTPLSIGVGNDDYKSEDLDITVDGDESIDIKSNERDKTVISSSDDSDDDDLLSFTPFDSTSPNDNSHEKKYSK